MNSFAFKQIPEKRNETVPRQMFDKFISVQTNTGKEKKNSPLAEMCVSVTQHQDETDKSFVTMNHSVFLSVFPDKQTPESKKKAGPRLKFLFTLRHDLSAPLARNYIVLKDKEKLTILFIWRSLFQQKRLSRVPLS